MTAPRRPVRLVLFDLDDVLYAYSRRRRIAALAAATGLDAALIEDRIWRGGIEDGADAGAYPDAASYLAAWSEALGTPVSRDLWTEARRAGMTPIGGSIALLSHLAAAAGTEVAVLTNNGPLVADERHRLAPEAAALTGDRFLVSSSFGRAKPDPYVYVAALARLGHAPAETLFIDDRADNVAGAREAGLSAHRFRTVRDLVAAVAAAMPDALAGFDPGRRSAPAGLVRSLRGD